MQFERAIVVCAFGWGKEFRLYKETLYVCNKAYRLARLTQVRLVVQQALGVPSARLELGFGHETVKLRGIAAVEDARKAAEYLLSWCGVEQEGASCQPVTSDLSICKDSQQLPSLKFHEQATYPVNTPHLLTLSMREEPHTGKGLLSSWKRERKTEHLAGVDVLPSIAVPVRLEAGERAYYSSRATRCAEPISETLRTTYPAQDHGLLILTDRRLLFIGRKSQLILEYIHLQHISRLEGALTFEADHWQKRAIFTMPQSEICASRLEAILQATARSLPDAAPDAHPPDAHKGHPYIWGGPTPLTPHEVEPLGEEVGISHV